MIIYRHLKIISSLALALGFMASAPALATDISTVPLNTYSAPTSTDVKPNVLFILDDSGSMDWDFMPDWACTSASIQNSSCSNVGQTPASTSNKSEYMFKNASYNGIYYNPAVTYTPPTAVGSTGATNTTTYPNMTGTSAATGGNSSATSSARNWSAVKNDAYGIQITGTTDLSSAARTPYFYTTLPGQYCDSPNLKTCNTASATSTAYPYPAPLRWCTTSALDSCGASYQSGYTYARAPSPRTATITVSSGTSTSVSGITVGGLQIMSGTATASATPSTVASNIAAQINLCTLTKVNNCDVVGYLASASGSGVTIAAPGTSSATPVITLGNSGTMTLTPTAFVAGSVPGENLRTTITPSVTSYPYPGNSTKAETRTDCAGSTCSYVEEMTNYANWWAYYHTRMQAMKTAASNAFATIDTSADIASNVSRFRLGYMSINDNTGSDFLNLGEFKSTQKFNWYNKLINASPGSSTPLRTALSDAGRLYAGMLNGTNFNGSTVVDPLQYSCQQNYAILSTDGFWNSGAGYKLNGSTAVGNQDGTLDRPYSDGASATLQTRTSSLQSVAITSTAQWLVSTRQLQSQTLTPQWTVSTSQLQSQTLTPQWTVGTSQLQSQAFRYTVSTSLLQSQAFRYTVTTTAVQSQTTALQKKVNNTWTNASTCTGGSSTCRYDTNNAGNWVTLAAPATCTVVNQTASSSSTMTGNRVLCQYAGTGTSAVSTACATASQASGSTNGTVYAPAVSCSSKLAVDPTPASWQTATSCNTSTSYCQYEPTPTITTSANCSARAGSSAPSYTVSSVIACTKLAVDATPASWQNANSCDTSTMYCQYVPTATPTTVATSCTDTRSSAPTYTVGLATTCAATTSLATGNWTNAASCTTSNTQGCQYAAPTTQTLSACNPVTASSGPNYTVPLATTCTAATPITGSWTNTSSCTVVSGSMNCQYAAATTQTLSACNPVTASSGPTNYTVPLATTCTSTTPLLAYGTPAPASSCTVSSTRACQYSAWSAWTSVTSCTAAAQSAGPTSFTQGTARECQGSYSTGNSDNLADVAAYYYNTDLRGTGAGTCTGPVIPPATTPTDLCENNVPASGRDVATSQHMTTFTLGLGSQGQMIYAPNDGVDYWNDTSGDFFDVKAGNSATSTTCTWQSSGICNWPTPVSNSNANIDDLWHAAINGHGTYFSAKDPSSLATALNSTLSIISNVPRPGAAAAAASSNPNVSASDNYVFSSSYRSVEWFGELVRQQISGSGSLTAQNWSAMRLLDCATTPWTASTTYLAGASYRVDTTCYTVTTDYTSGTTFDSSSTGLDLSKSVVVNVDEAATTKVPVTTITSRTIYTKRGSALVDFTVLSNLSPTQQGYFTTPTISAASGGLSQFCTSGASCLSSADQTSASGQALVSYLSGDRSKEGTYFRKRVHVLGDIVASEARYVKTPMFNYADANYSAYKALKADRTGMVYVGANDGMLHAFDATSGQEAWAYIPEIVLPNLYKLADKNYGTQHQYFVDDTPEVGDICPNGSSGCAADTWKTILVGGLNRGGKGYYALDITNPAVPLLLWEFTNSNLGYTYGNPRITKLKNGTWVVLLTSGYNSTDGLGRVYVLNANTGALISDSSGNNSISTGVAADLARLGAHVLTPDTDNTTVAAYGGDTGGNLWRFDINGDIGASGRDAQLLVSFTDSAGTPQPVTTKPTIASVNGRPVVYVGTGRYLGTTDVTNTSFQAFYAVLDKYDSTTYGNPRVTANGFIHQTLTSTTCPTGTPTSVCSPSQEVRTSTSNAVDWTVNNGWYIDFLTGGERSSTDPTLGLGSLLFTTIRPQTSSVNACGAPGNPASFLYVLNYLTGAAVVGANTVTGVSLGAGLVTRPVLIELADGSVRALIRSANAVATGTDMGATSILSPTINAPSSANLRRVSWRELTTR